jgi:hypothetical protein
VLLRQRPPLVSAAVRRFYERGPEDLRAAGSRTRFATDRCGRARAYACYRGGACVRVRARACMRVRACAFVVCAYVRARTCVCVRARAFLRVHACASLRECVHV